MDAPVEHAHGDAGSHSIEEIQKHVRTYTIVGVTLAVLTVVTVVAAWVQLPLHQAIGVALAIASVKATLVAAVFMHLLSERKLIYWVLVLCAVFFVVLMLIPVFTQMDQAVV
jgi:cytochrome c oxidase subunit 4